MVHLLIRKHADIQGLLMTSDEARRSRLETPPSCAPCRPSSIPVPAPPASVASCPQLGHLSVVYISVCVSVLPAGRVACPRGRSDLGPWRGPLWASGSPTLAAPVDPPVCFEDELKALHRSLAAALTFP